MDWDQWGFAFFMADRERLRTEEQAREEMEEMQEEYEEWCEDHGIPPPPRRETPYSAPGCGCCVSVAMIMACICVVMVMALFW